MASQALITGCTGAGTRTTATTCFICNDKLLDAAEDDKLAAPSLLSVISQLFHLNITSYHSHLAHEVTCFKCGQILSSVLDLYTDLRKIQDEIEQNRFMVKNLITNAYEQNSTIPTKTTNTTEVTDNSTYEFIKTRLALQDAIIHHHDEGPETPSAKKSTRNTTISTSSSPQNTDNDDDDLIHKVNKIEQNESDEDTANTNLTTTNSFGSTCNLTHKLMVKVNRMPVLDQLIRQSHETHQKPYFDNNKQNYDPPTAAINVLPSLKKSTQKKAKKKAGPAIPVQLQPEPEPGCTVVGQVVVGGSGNDGTSMDYFCTICGKPFKTDEYAKIHVITHISGDKPFKCSMQDCDAGYWTSRALKRHGREFHIPGKPPEQEKKRSKAPPTILGCPQCPRTFNKPCNLKIHLESHKPMSERSTAHTCNICSMKFLRHSCLQRHLKHVHDPNYKSTRKPAPKVQCPKCELQVINLPSHLRTHDEAKPFLCPTCGACFRAKKTLDVHLRIHSDLRPYACKVCPAKFRTSHGLNRHTYIHSEERTFVCEHCGKSFRFKSSLTEHLHIHLQVKPHRCNVCGRRYKERVELEEHLEVDHTKEQRPRRKEKKERKEKKRVKPKWRVVVIKEEQQYKDDDDDDHGEMSVDTNDDGMMPYPPPPVYNDHEVETKEEVDEEEEEEIYTSQIYSNPPWC